jgi:hypothetical protein
LHACVSEGVHPARLCKILKSVRHQRLAGGHPT